MNHALCWRAFCWFEKVKYKPAYGGQVWKWHFRNYQALLEHNRTRERVTLELAS